MKTLITDTLDKTVRTTGFKGTLRRDSEAELAKAEQDRIDRIAKDQKEHDDWVNGRGHSVDVITETKEAMTQAADIGDREVTISVALGLDSTKETAYDRGLLDGLVTWLKNESFKFEVVRSSTEASETRPASYALSVRASW